MAHFSIGKISGFGSSSKMREGTTMYSKCMGAIMAGMLALLTGKVFAIDTQSTSVETALSDKTSKCVLFGFVTNAKIEQVRPGSVKGLAKLRVADCLKGACKKGQEISLSYYPLAIFPQGGDEGLAQVDMPVGDYVLLVLHKSCASKQEFVSDVIQGIDFGYRCSVFPYSFSDSESRFRCINLMYEKEISRSLTRDQIVRMIDGH